MALNDDSAYRKSPGEPGELPEWGRIIQRALKLTLHTVVPVKVIAYTPATLVPKPLPATVLVQPSVISVFYAPDGKEIPLPMAQIPAAVIGHFSSTTHRQTAPISPGDCGWVFVSERSIDKWRSSSGEPRDPVHSHTHNLADALFLPVGPPGGLGLQVDPTGYVIATNTGAPFEPGEFHLDILGNMMLEGPTIRFGRGAIQPLVLGGLLQSALTTWTTAIASAGATHAAAQPPTPVSNGAYLTAITAATSVLAGQLATILSTKVFTE